MEEAEELKEEDRDGWKKEEDRDGWKEEQKQKQNPNHEEKPELGKAKAKP
jgi:hypothetical protein